MLKANDEPILQFIVNYLWGQMVIPDSQFFLPKMLSEQQTSYDPYHVDEWDMPQLPEKVDAACNDDDHLGKCDGYPSLKLKDVTIKGLYNLQPGANKPTIKNTNLETTLNFCKLPPGKYVTSQYITVTGSYIFTQKCTPLMGGDDYTVIGNGTFEAQIFEAQGYGNMDIIPDPDHADRLLVRVNAMALIAGPTTTVATCTAPGAQKNSNICISIHMSSGDQFNFLANQAANYDQVSKAMVDNINAKLRDPGALKDLSNMLTEKVNNIFGMKTAGLI
jgi:hypothetical protein